MNKLCLLLIVCFLLVTVANANEQVTFTVKDRFLIIDSNNNAVITFVETTDNRLYYMYSCTNFLGPRVPDAAIESYTEFAPNTTHIVNLKDNKYEIDYR
jgi:hypothetical protein